MEMWFDSDVKNTVQVVLESYFINCIVGEILVKCVLRINDWNVSKHVDISFFYLLRAYLFVHLDGDEDVLSIWIEMRTDVYFVLKLTSFK